MERLRSYQREHQRRDCDLRGQYKLDGLDRGCCRLRSPSCDDDELPDRIRCGPAPEEGQERRAAKYSERIHCEDPHAVAAEASVPLDGMNMGERR